MEKGLDGHFFEAAYSGMSGLPAYIRGSEVCMGIAWTVVVVLSIGLPLAVGYIVVKECRGFK